MQRTLDRKTRIHHQSRLPCKRKMPKLRHKDPRRRTLTHFHKSAYADRRFRIRMAKNRNMVRLVVGYFLYTLTFLAWASIMQRLVRYNCKFRWIGNLTRSIFRKTASDIGQCGPWYLWPFCHSGMSLVMSSGYAQKMSSRHALSRDPDFAFVFKIMFYEIRIYF